LKQATKELEIRLINNCLDQGFDRATAARELGISERTLRSKIKLYKSVLNPLPSSWFIKERKGLKLDSVLLMSYFQQGLKLKEIADLMDCKYYKVRESLIELLGEKRYNELKDVYRFCKRENMEIPKEYLIQ
jgi:hypothetical protein